MSSKGRGCPLLHPVLNFLEFRYDGYTSGSHLWLWGESCIWGGWGSKTQELGSLIRLRHCFTSSDPPTFGILLYEHDIPENAFHRSPSTWGWLTKRQLCLDFYHLGFYWGHDSHGLLPTNGLVLWKDMGGPVNQPQWLWWMCLRLHSSLRPSQSASSPSPLHRWHLHCGLMSPWASIAPSSFPFILAFLLIKPLYI